MLIYFRREYSLFNVMSGRGYPMAGATRLSPTLEIIENTMLNSVSVNSDFPIIMNSVSLNQNKQLIQLDKAIYE